jgi:ribosomal protein L25 (general stress protein Ctc)
MKTISLSAGSRKETGKGPNRRLRRKGLIPAVLYGQSAEPVLLSVEDREFHRAISRQCLKEGPQQADCSRRAAIDNGKSHAPAISPDRRVLSVDAVVSTLDPPCRRA